LTAQQYVKKHPKLETGRKIIFKCLICDNEQIGYSKLDGFACEKCGGYITPIREAENPYFKYSYNTGILRNGERIYGIDNKWLMWNIKNGFGLPKIEG
jgi:ribosomal protein S27E